MFLAFFSKKRPSTLKLDDNVARRKVEGGDEKIAHKKI
jgi:hypothetical protein